MTVASGSLAIRVERRLPVTVVALAGDLTMPAAARLRQTLLKCLADCPDAVVIDLSGATVDTDLPLAVFRAVRRHASAWPAIPVSLCSPPPALSARLARLGMDRVLSVFPSRQRALAAAGTAPTVARADRQFLQSVNAPAQARELIVEICRAWDLPELVDPARLVVSELITNAVLHGRGAPHLTVVLRHPYLHLIVRDDSPDPPVRRTPPPAPGTGTALSGWGLQMVDRAVHSWGHLANETGKAVWAMLRSRQQTGAAAPAVHPQSVRPHSASRYHRRAGA